MIVTDKSNIRVIVRFCYIGTGSLAAEVAAEQTLRLTCTVSLHLLLEHLQIIVFSVSAGDAANQTELSTYDVQSAGPLA